MLQKKSGAEEVEAFAQSFMKAFNMTTFAPGDHAPPGFASTSWQVGFAPGYVNISVTPNCGAMLRTMVVGSIRTVLFNPFVDIADAGIPEKMDEIKEFLGSMTTTDVATLKGKGVPCEIVEQGRDSVLYIPAGWICLDEVDFKELLVYGVRKSFYVKSEGQQKQVVKAAASLTAQGLNVEKMELMIASWAK